MTSLMLSRSISGPTAGWTFHGVRLVTSVTIWRRFLQCTAYCASYGIVRLVLRDNVLQDCLRRQFQQRSRFLPSSASHLRLYKFTRSARSSSQVELGQRPIVTVKLGPAGSCDNSSGGAMNVTTLHLLPQILPQKYLASRSLGTSFQVVLVEIVRLLLRSDPLAVRIAHANKPEGLRMQFVYSYHFLGLTSSLLE